jgi:hypothetical protein
VIEKFIIMKKIILSLLLVAGIAFSSDAQKVKYYYYPGANVYYDIANKQYIYPSNGTWTTVTSLPAGMAVTNKPRVIMYNETGDVWQNNQQHVTKYKTKTTHLPKGKAVGYKGTNPNKPVPKTNRPVAKTKMKQKKN